MRVVFLTHNYPRWSGDLSGAFLATLAAGLVRRGVEVRVLAPSDEGQGGEEERDGVFVRRVRYAPRRLETIAYRGTMAGALRAPGGWRALAGLWRALRRAARDASGDAVKGPRERPNGLERPTKLRETHRIPCVPRNFVVSSNPGLHPHAERGVE